MLKCKICGGSRITSADGELFICADCGCNYTLEAARRLMQSEESAPAAAPESKRASRPVPPAPAAVEQSPAPAPAEKEQEAQDAFFADVDRHQWRLWGLCEYCGGEFEGLLVKRCKVCGRKKSYSIFDPSPLDGDEGEEDEFV